MLTRVNQIVKKKTSQIERGEFNPNMDHSESNNLIVYIIHGYMTKKRMNKIMHRSKARQVSNCKATQLFLDVNILSINISISR